MSSLRHRDIYQSDVARAPAIAWRACAPAEPASAAPAKLILQGQHPFAKRFSANGNLSLFRAGELRESTPPESSTRPTARALPFHLQRALSGHNRRDSISG